MYLDYYSLERHPFRITPDTSLFFSGGTPGRGVVLEAMLYAIETGEGIIKVVGEVGSGKTMLCRMLEESLPKTTEIVYIANPNLAADDILYAIAIELRLPISRDTSKLLVMQHLQSYLLKQHGANRKVVVIIEEAQGMPIATLEEIRLFSNLETQRDKLMQIVLFGQPELDKNLNARNIRQLRERITHSFNLQPLTRSDTSEYIRYRLQAAGCPLPQVFCPKAEKLIAKASKGLTRRINILADKAMLAAYADSSISSRSAAVTNGNKPVVQVEHVKAAIKDCDYINNSLFVPRRLAEVTALACLPLIGFFLWPTTLGAVDWSESLHRVSSWVSAKEQYRVSSVGVEQAPESTGIVAEIEVPEANRESIRPAAAPLTPAVSESVAPPQVESAATLDDVQQPQQVAASLAEVAATNPSTTNTPPEQMRIQTLDERRNDLGNAANSLVTEQANAMPTARMHTAVTRVSTTTLVPMSPSPRALAAEHSAGEGQPVLSEGQSQAGGRVSGSRELEREEIDPVAVASEAERTPAEQSIASEASGQPAQSEAPDTSGAPERQQIAPSSEASRADGAELIAMAPEEPPVSQRSEVSPHVPPLARALDRSRNSSIDLYGIDVAPLIQERLMATMDWMAETGPGSYTVQVLSGRFEDVDHMEYYMPLLEQTGLIDSIYVCVSTNSNGSYWTVKFGDYPGYNVAKNAIDLLPTQLAQHGAFVQDMDKLLCNTNNELTTVFMEN